MKNLSILTIAVFISWAIIANGCAPPQITITVPTQSPPDSVSQSPPDSVSQSQPASGTQSPPAPAKSDALAGIVITPEPAKRTGYKRTDYRYPQSTERRIIFEQGGHFSPYSMKCFTNLGQTDIEHIVATAEAHDSGASKWTVSRRTVFAQDLDNLTTAAPALNRNQKRDKDPGEWLPANNRCWYVQTWIDVKRKYGLSMDQAEADAIRKVLSGCSSTALVKPNCN